MTTRNSSRFLIRTGLRLRTPQGARIPANELVAARRRIDPAELMEQALVRFEGELPPPAGLPPRDVVVGDRGRLYPWPPANTTQVPASDA